MDTPAVRLIVPLAGSIVDFHHLVIRSPPRVSEQHRKALRAILGAAIKKAAIKLPFDNYLDLILMLFYV